jgi:hypothetical protein
MAVVEADPVPDRQDFASHVPPKVLKKDLGLLRRGGYLMQHYQKVSPAATYVQAYATAIGLVSSKHTHRRNHRTDHRRG